MRTRSAIAVTGLGLVTPIGSGWQEVSWCWVLPLKASGERGAGALLGYNGHFASGELVNAHEEYGRNRPTETG